MKTYFINYSFPKEYKGSYIVKGEDGIDASEKLNAYLKSKYGEFKDSYCQVTEVENGQLFFV